MRCLRVGLFGHLVFGLVAVSLCAICLAMLFLYTRFHGEHAFFYEGTLQGFAVSIGKSVQVVDGSVTVTVPDSTVRDIVQDGGRFIVLDSEGRKLAGSVNVAHSFVPFDDVTWRYFRRIDHATSAELFGLSARIPGVSPPTYLQIAFPAGQVIYGSVIHKFAKDIAWLWLPFLLLILTTNLIVARIALRPLARTVEEAKSIEPGGVAVYLSEAKLPDDLLTLVRTVNDAFGRLRKAFGMQEEFVSDMAHELRTPVAIMKLQLAAIEAPYARVLERDLAAMERLVEQLLDRARLGHFRIEPGSVVDLREIARETSAFLAPRIVERALSIEVLADDDPALVAGGRDDIFRAVRNLIENALEHSPEKGLISVEVSDDPSLVVLDRGPGFPDQVLDAEHRRRGPLRSDRRNGAGLGLSIVERTLLAHGGELRLSNRADGGGRAEMRFPRPTSGSHPAKA